MIVSQLLRGLAEVCAPAPRCDGAVLARALAHAAALARAAVRRPAEGTILTVADAAALAAAGRRETLTGGGDRRAPRPLARRWPGPRDSCRC